MTARFRSAFSGSSGFVAVGSRVRVVGAPDTRPALLRDGAGGSPALVRVPSSFSAVNGAV